MYEKDTNESPPSVGSPENFLPLKPSVHQILLVLAEGHLHGYGIIQAVRQRSKKRIRLTSGAFYRHLGKLMERGLVQESRRRPREAPPRRGAYYRLTPLGRRVLAAEGRRLSELVAQTEKLGLLSGRGSA